MNLHRVCAAYLPHPEKTSLGETSLPTPNLGARWGWVSTPKPGRFTLDKRPGAHCKGGWADFSVSLNAFGKSHPKWGSHPGPSSQQPVAVPTTLSRQPLRSVKDNNMKIEPQINRLGWVRVI